MLNNPRHSDWTDETTLLACHPVHQNVTPAARARRDFEEFFLICWLEGGGGGQGVACAPSWSSLSRASAKVAST